MTTDRPPEFDLHRILATLERHHVQYLLVGGAAAQAHGAIRATDDADCLAAPNDDNYERLAAALRELNARLSVEGLSDEEARQLPVRIDAATLGRLEIAT